MSYSASGGAIEVNELRQDSRAVIGFAMAHFATRFRDRYERNRHTLWEPAAAGELRPAAHAEPGLDGAAEAHRIVESRESLGKVVLRPAQTGSPGVPAGSRS